MHSCDCSIQEICAKAGLDAASEVSTTIKKAFYRNSVTALMTKDKTFGIVIASLFFIYARILDATVTTSITLRLMPLMMITSVTNSSRQEPMNTNPPSSQQQQVRGCVSLLGFT